MKHGGISTSIAEWKPQPSCQISRDRDACDQLSFSKVTWHILSMLIFIAVSNASKYHTLGKEIRGGNITCVAS